MLTKPKHEGSAPPSPWILRFAPLVPPGARVLDLAAGGGRHARLFQARGCRVVAVDRAIEGLLDAPGIEAVALDLETGAPWSLGGGFDAVVVTNYLHRPLLPAIAASLAPGGLLLYETFARGNERFGRPSNPDFLLERGELIAAFPMLTVLAFEEGMAALPRAALVQRIAAWRPPDGDALPPAIPDGR